MTRVIGLICLMMSQTVFADSEGRWRFRAREHYELHKIKSGSEVFDFKGFSNTLNYWYEVPKNYAIGFSFSPILAIAKIDQGQVSSEFGQKLKQYSIGVEFKKFITGGAPSVFYRLGSGLAVLDGRGEAGNLAGGFVYLGIGTEIMIGRVGVAPEFALRQAFYESGIQSTTITPSIGFHLYMLH